VVSADEPEDGDPPCGPEPAEVAAEAGLRYVTDAEPGIRRRRRGRGFSYEAPNGGSIPRADRARIDRLDGD